MARSTASRESTGRTAQRGRALSQKRTAIDGKTEEPLSAGSANRVSAPSERLSRIAEADLAFVQALGRLRAQEFVAPPQDSRGRAIDGIPELLANATSLEAELQIIADALFRVVSCRCLAIYTLADSYPSEEARHDGPSFDSSRLTPVVKAGDVIEGEWPAEELVQLGVRHWVERTDLTPWIAGVGATVLPVIFRSQCVGAVAISHGEAGMPADARLRDLGNLLGLAALTIGNHRLTVSGHRRIAELHALREVGRVVGVELSTDRILDGIFEASAKILSYDTASLFVVDHEAGELRLEASKNIPAEIASASRFKIGEGVIGWVIAQDRPATVPDTLEDDRYKLAGSGKRRAHSLLVVPLRMRGQVIAALSFAKHRRNAFVPHDLELAEVIAAYAAQALEHSRLAKTASEVETLRQGSELLSSISHDIRAPLSMIRFVIGTLKHEFPDMDPHQIDHLNKISRASDQLGRMINAVLETSRLEANLLSLKREKVSLLELVETVTSSLAWRASDRHELVIEVPDELSINADVSQIERVLSNLVDNALKYSPNGGEVTVRAWSEDGGIFIAISDQGVGIEEASLSQVFERYYRTNDAPEGTGYGLGLYICKRIIEAHGGAVRADAKPGQGSTFTIWLPLDE